MLTGEDQIDYCFDGSYHRFDQQDVLKKSSSQKTLKSPKSLKKRAKSALEIPKHAKLSNSIKKLQKESISRNVSTSHKIHVPSTLSKSSKMSHSFHDDHSVVHFSDFVPWIHLRNDYLEQIYNVSSMISASGMEIVGDTNVRALLYPLVLAYRKITYRILDNYGHATQNSSTYGKDHEHDNVRQYVASMAHSLDGIANPVMETWIGVDTTLNPLITTFRLDGMPATTKTSLAKSVSFTDFNHLNNLTGTFVDRSLLLSEIEETRCFDLGKLIWNHYSSLVDALEAPVISPIRPSYMSNNHESDDDDDINDTTHFRYKQLLCLAKWRAVYQMRIKEKLAVQWNAQLVQRKIFYSILQHAGQCIKFRLMQQNRLTKMLTSCFQQWTTHTIKYKCVNAFYEARLRRIKSICFRELFVYKENNRDTREFKQRQKERTLRIAFKCLSYNTILNKYMLKRRLKYESELTFYDNHIRQKYYKRWSHICEINFAVDILEEVMNMIQKRRAFARFKEDFADDMSDFQRYIWNALKVKEIQRMWRDRQPHLIPQRYIQRVANSTYFQTAKSFFGKQYAKIGINGDNKSEKNESKER